MAALDSQTRADLLEIIDGRAAHKATIITSQWPIEHWHAWIGDATMADAILDRVLQKNHRFNLTGESKCKSEIINGQLDPIPTFLTLLAHKCLAYGLTRNVSQISIPK